MGDNVRLLAIGAFFVLVLGAIGFLVMQGDDIPLDPAATAPPGPASTDTGERNAALPGAPASAAPATAPSTEASTSPEPVEETTGEEPVVIDASAAEGDAEESGRRPRGPGIVKGTVTWHGDGAPVSGASVLLDYTRRENDYDTYPLDRHEWRDTTDANGEFRIANVPVRVVFGDRLGELTVIAEKDGASAVSSAGLTDDVTQAIVDLELRPAGEIRGTVVDEAGEPVAGALVAPREMTDEAMRRQSYGARNLWATTGEDGQFLLKHLLAGSWKLLATAPDYAAKVTDAVDTGDTGVTIVLARGASATGRVIDAESGEPVANTMVTFNDQKNRTNEARATTDENGIFTVESLGDSEYELGLDDEERVLIGKAPRFTIANAEPVEDLTLVTAQGASISGMITDADTGQPISGVRIQARGNQVNRYTRREGASDATGFYRISGVPAGSYTLRRRWKENYLHGEYREDKSVTVALGESLENIDFEVKRGLTLSGVVVDQAGDPVEGIRVAASPLVDNGEGETVNTTEGGAFALRGFSPDVDVTIQVSGRGYSAPKYGPVNTGDSGMDDIRIAVEPGASIAGVVVDKAGKPLPDMYVTARSTTGESHGSESTDAEGAFHMKSLEAGAYQLSARRRNSWSSNNQNAGAEVTVSQGQALTGVRVIFEAGPGIVIAGRITNTDREPVENASINAHSMNGGSNAHTQSDEDGKYELTVDEDVSYRMYVHHGQYSTQQREGVAAGSRDVDFVLEGRGTVEGRVLDATTGRPIAQFGIAHQRGHASSVRYQHVNYTSFFNEEGNFSLEGVESGEATLFARAEGYAPGLQQAPHVTPNDVTGGIEFRLQPSAIINGTVVNLEGEPIESARIFLARRVDDWMIRQGGYGGAVATTGAGGEFTVNSVGEDLGHITAVHPDYPNTTVPISLRLGEETQVEIVMAGGATIEGTVYVNGAPAPNESVYAGSTDGGGGKSARTDDNGYFKIENMPAGDLHISTNITRDGTRRGKSETVTVQAGFTTTIDLHVEFGTAAIEGIITSGGVPVPNGQIVALLQDDSSGENAHTQGTVDTGGAYRIGGLSAGNYRVMVHAVPTEGGARQSRFVDTAVADGQTIQLDIEMTSGLHARGAVSGVSDTNRCQVIALTGSVDPNALQTLMHSPETRTRMAGYSGVGSDGTFDISGLEAGVYTIIAAEFGQAGWDDARIASQQIEVSESAGAEVNLALP